MCPGDENCVGGRMSSSWAGCAVPQSSQLACKVAWGWGRWRRENLGSREDPCSRHVAASMYCQPLGASTYCTASHWWGELGVRGRPLLKASCWFAALCCAGGRAFRVLGGAMVACGAHRPLASKLSKPLPQVLSYVFPICCMVVVLKECLNPQLPLHGSGIASVCMHSGIYSCSVLCVVVGAGCVDQLSGYIDGGPGYPGACINSVSSRGRRAPSLYCDSALRRR